MTVYKNHEKMASMMYKPNGMLKRAQMLGVYTDFLDGNFLIRTVYYVFCEQVGGRLFVQYPNWFFRYRNTRDDSTVLLPVYAGLDPGYPGGTAWIQRVLVRELSRVAVVLIYTTITAA